MRPAGPPRRFASLVSDEKAQLGGATQMPALQSPSGGEKSASSSAAVVNSQRSRANQRMPPMRQLFSQRAGVRRGSLQKALPTPQILRCHRYLVQRTSHGMVHYPSTNTIHRTLPYSSIASNHMYSLRHHRRRRRHQQQQCQRSIRHGKRAKLAHVDAIGCACRMLRRLSVSVMSTGKGR